MDLYPKSYILFRFNFFFPPIRRDEVPTKYQLNSKLCCFFIIQNYVILINSLQIWANFVFTP